MTIHLEARLHNARAYAAYAIGHVRAMYEERDGVRTPREDAAIHAMLSVEGEVTAALQAAELARLGEAVTEPQLRVVR
ncbi:MAG TPA: hypothetical protein VNJ04_05000 [Gemmatimonadaceae bacterium]|nr:hypothetical protein [Gemmatimonadaceae bacterium]